jgi:hypothetical protein
MARAFLFYLGDILFALIVSELIIAFGVSSFFSLPFSNASVFCRVKEEHPGII